MSTFQEEYHNIMNDLENEDSYLKMILGKVSRLTGYPKEQIVWTFVVVLSLYLVVGFFAEVVCNVAAFVYPAFASMRALTTADKGDDTQWLTYWTVFGIFSLVDFASEAIIGWFPFYWMAKLFFLIYLYLPLIRGAERIWSKYLNPFCDIVRLEEWL